MSPSDPKGKVIDDILSITERLVGFSSRLKAEKNDPVAVDMVAASLSELAMDLQDCIERLSSD